MKEVKINKIEEELREKFYMPTLNKEKDLFKFFCDKIEETEKEAEERFNLGKVFVAEIIIESAKREERERIIKILQNSPIHQGSDICMCSEDLKEIIKNLIKK